MPTSADPAAAYTLATMLLDCALEQLADTDAGTPERACVIAGGIAWEDSCECGDLTVAITGSYATASFPSPAATTAASFRQSRCGAPIVAHTFEVTMLRCVPTGGADAEPPPCEELSAAALTATIDADAVRRGVTCCLATAVRAKDERNSPVIVDFAVGSTSFVGPAGACGGSVLSVTVGILNASCC